MTQAKTEQSRYEEPSTIFCVLSNLDRVLDIASTCKCS